MDNPLTALVRDKLISQLNLPQATQLEFVFEDWAAAFGADQAIQMMFGFLSSFGSGALGFFSLVPQIGQFITPLLKEVFSLDFNKGVLIFLVSKKSCLRSFTIHSNKAPPPIFSQGYSNKIVAPKAKNILNTKAAATPQAIIFFLFLGAKFAAIKPIMIALSAAITMSINTICMVIINCSNILNSCIYYFLIK